MAAELEARMRITAETTQAAKAVRDLQNEVKQVKTADAGADPLAKTADQMKRSAAEAEKAASRAQQGVRRSADEAGKALRRTQHQIQAVSQQIPDIVQGLLSGQSAFQLLVQQGGQVVQVTGGVGNAFRALGSQLTAFRVLAGGAAGVVGTLVFGMAQGALESIRLNKLLATTGNVADTSLGKLDAMAKQISSTQNVAIGSVRETLEAVVASGAYVGETVQSATTAVAALSKVTSGTSDEILKQLSVLENGVSQGAAKLNKAYNFLTIEQFRQIRALESQGKGQEAMRLTLDALSSTITQRSVPAIGSLERGWIAVKNAVSGALDAMKAIGREATPETRLAELEARIRSLTKGQTKTPNAFAAAEVARLEQEAKPLRQDVKDNRIRRANEAAAKVAAQKAIEDEQNAQESKAQVAQAGLQKRLALELAALDARRSATERANAQGLLSEEQYSLALSRIDQQRLEAQIAALDKSRAVVASRRPGLPNEVRAQNAELQRLDVQRIALQADLEAKRADDQIKGDAKALERARTAAQDWAQIWTRANDRIREFASEAAATQARLMSDPMARAAAEAEESVLNMRRELADLTRDLNIKITATADPGMRAELEKQLAQVSADGAKAIGEEVRKNLVRSLASIASEQQALLAAKEDQINAEIAAGQKTVADGEREILGLRAEQVRLLDEILKRMEALASTPEEKAVVEQLRAQLTSLADMRTEFDRTAQGAGVSALKGVLDDITTGAKEGKDVLLDMVGSFAKAMLNVLNQRLAEQLFAQFTSAAGSSGGGGGFFATIGTWIASLFHGGGVVGQGSQRTRAVNPAMFALAPRFHDGLLPGEFPAILEKGETVRTRRQEADLQRQIGGTGGVAISVKVEGATGSEAGMRQGGTGLANDLASGVMDICNAWALREMRPGGLLDRS